MFAFGLAFPFKAGVAFFALPLGPCRPIVGSGVALLADLVLVGAMAAGLDGGGTLGGTAREKGVLAGLLGDGARPTSAFLSSSRGLRNMSPHRCRPEECGQGVSLNDIIDVKATLRV